MRILASRIKKRRRLLTFLLEFYPLLLAPIFGSFIGAVVDRWPRGETLDGRSICRSCGTTLGVIDLVPILTFVILRGKCRHCSAAIPRETIGTELLAILTMMPLIFVIDPGDKAIGMLLGLALLTLALIDRRHYWLPDDITLPLIVLGILFALMKGETPALASAVGAVAGYSLIAGLRAVYKHVKGIEAIGLGDAKLLAAIGAWLGWMALPFVILVASVLGLIGGLAGTKDVGRYTKVPFGLYLSIVFYGAWLGSKTPMASHWLATYMPVL